MTFFQAIPQNALLHINFVFRRGNFCAVVVQTIYYADGYSGFLLNWRKAILGTFSLASETAGSHGDITAVFDVGFERQLSPNFSCALLFGFVLFCNFLFGFTVKNITILLLRISMLTAPIAEANDRVLSQIHGNRLRSCRHKQPDIGHTCSNARAQKYSILTVKAV